MAYPINQIKERINYGPTRKNLYSSHPTAIRLGLPSRITPNNYPLWYTTYAGDFIWAMMVFFLFRLFFRWQTLSAFLVALVTTYFIEFTQLFHPAWLDYLRSYKLVGLIIGYSFLWSDIIAYTAGISLGALIDKGLITRVAYKIGISI